MARLNKALAVCAVVLVALINSLLAVPQEAEEGSLLSVPNTGGAKLLSISAETLLPKYSDLASGYTRKRLVYIIQDETKAVRGKAEFSFGFVMENGLACADLVKEYQYPFFGRSRLVVSAQNLAPMKYRLEIFESAGELGKQSPVALEVWTAEYFYDMVAVRQDAGDTGVFSSFRRPMKSLDLDGLYLLMSKLAVAKLPDKSALLVTAPFQHRNHAALLEKLGSDYIYAADAEQRPCIRLRLSFMGFEEEYFVETREPNRVVKFTVGGLTFTLQEDLTDKSPLFGEGGGEPGGAPTKRVDSNRFLLGGKE